MSVQKVSSDFSVVSPCPLIITPIDTFITYQTASIVATNVNVNGRASDCFTSDYAYILNGPIQKPSSCCSNNALKVQSQYQSQIQGINNVGMMNYGY